MGVVVLFRDEHTVAGDAGQLYGGSNEPEAGWDAGDTREWHRG